MGVEKRGPELFLLPAKVEQDPALRAIEDVQRRRLLIELLDVGVGGLGLNLKS